MKLMIGALLVAAVLLAFQEPEGEARVWDQAKARAKVEQALRIEKEGAAWDRIPWLTDPAEAAARAKRRRQPILVFFYLAKRVGPPAAPC